LKIAILSIMVARFDFYSFKIAILSIMVARLDFYFDKTGKMTKIVRYGSLSRYRNNSPFLNIQAKSTKAVRNVL
ncbi:TPA: hypothetical protein ACHVIE_001999, partial [Streptococcus suis]